MEKKTIQSARATKEKAKLRISALTEKQQERIIKNCVECIMDDLDNFYFDEMFMDWFKKNMHNFLMKKFKEEKIFNFKGNIFNWDKAVLEEQKQ